MVSEGGVVSATNNDAIKADETRSIAPGSAGPSGMMSQGALRTGLTSAEQRRKSTTQGHEWHFCTMEARALVVQANQKIWHDTAGVTREL